MLINTEERGWRNSLGWRSDTKKKNILKPVPIHSFMISGYSHQPAYEGYDYKDPLSGRTDMKMWHKGAMSR